VRNPRVSAEEREKAAEAAFADACERLKPLTKPTLSWAIISWGDPKTDPRDKYEAAIEYVIALLDPALPTNSAQAETYDSRAQHAADELLGAQASIVRKFILPALRLGRPPRGHGPRNTLARDRYIAGVVTTICRQHKLDPYRNPISEHDHNGCAIVAKALARLGIELTEKTVERIYAEHRQL
jgi:hypothetical protein